MLYEQAERVLAIQPRSRVRIVLASGEVLETPKPFLANLSPKRCVVSPDGTRLRFLKWSDVAEFEAVEAPQPGAEA